MLQLFYHGNTGGFLLLPLEGGKWDTSRPPTTPTVELHNIIENWEDIQPIRKKGKVKNQILIVREHSEDAGEKKKKLEGS